MSIQTIQPPTSAATVTTSNTVDLVNYSRGLMVAVTGNVKVDLVDSGTAIVLTGLAVGVMYPICVKRVYATDTTATGITVFW